MFLAAELQALRNVRARVGMLSPLVPRDLPRYILFPGYRFFTNTARLRKLARGCSATTRRQLCVYGSSAHAANRGVVAFPFLIRAIYKLWERRVKLRTPFSEERVAKLFPLGKREVFGTRSFFDTQRREKFFGNFFSEFF